MKRLMFSLLVCVATGDVIAQNSREMYALSSALVQLSSAINSTLLYDRPSKSLSSEQLLKLSAAKNPRLLTSFAGYRLEVLRDNNKAVVRVCDYKGRHVLLEDIVCTPKIDGHHWREFPAKQCSFTLRPIGCGK